MLTCPRQEEVREHTRLLMKRDNHGSPFDPRGIPSAEAVENWSPSQGPACTAEEFKPDMNGTPGSPWNRSVASVFVNDFVKTGQYQSQDEVAVKRAFTSHLRHLIRQYKEQSEERSPEDVLEKKNLRSQQQRRLGVRRASSLAPPLY